MMATYGTQLATATACVRTVTSERPTPIATSAEISGRSAASTERRNAKNNTTSAAAMPSITLVVLVPSPPPGSASSIAPPPSWTFSSELSADCAVEISVVTAAAGTS